MKADPAPLAAPMGRLQVIKNLLPEHKHGQN